MIMVVLVAGALAVLVAALHPPPRAEVPWAPRLHLGVDLQGGMEVVLEVQEGPAVEREVVHDLRFLRSRLVDEGLPDAVLRPAGYARFEIVSAASPTTVAALVDRMLGTYRATRSEGGVHGFELAAARQAQILAAVSEMMLQDDIPGRAPFRCNDAARVERWSDRMLWVQLPGEPEWWCPEPPPRPRRPTGHLSWQRP